MYYNYHKHTMYSNVRVNDCIASYQDYIKRAKELGHTAIFSTEHGFCGDIFSLYDLCKQNDLKCIHGYESYFVYDRHEKTKFNWHICIISLNKNGMKKNNYINSIANINGFYRQPRVDMELLLQLPPEDVVITTACINNCIAKPNPELNKDYVKDFLLPLKEHFGDHFFIEIQSHDEDSQIKANKLFKQLSEEHGIKLIHGCDTHYIDAKEKIDRENFIRGKRINKKNEDIDLWEDYFILDYPTEEEIYERYEKQGVFSRKEIENALKNTLIFDKAEDLCLEKNIKMPNIYPQKTKKERVDMLKKLINKKWIELTKKHFITEEMKKIMVEGIRKEMEVIEQTQDEVMIADYFLLNEKIIRLGVEKGGVITRTGRGSGASYFINTLLGFTTIDRFDAPVKLYPSRFISTARLLETRSLPDIDFNVAEDVPFIESSKEVLGEGHCYRMVAFGTQKESAAFRNLCRAKQLKIDEYNEVGKNIDDYRDDDKWKSIIDEAKNQIDVIDSISPSPCSFLLYDGNILEDVGVMRVKDELCACIDKNVADTWKFLKNDILNVTVWKLISETFKLVNRPIPYYKDVINETADPQNKVWELFAKGITTTINQCSTDNGKRLVKSYKPKSIGELALFVAMIRPGAASLLDNFLQRNPYTTGVSKIDDLLSDSSHYMAFQENIMTVLSYLGVSEEQTYEVIKKISKKKFKEQELEDLKRVLSNTFKEKIGTVDGFETIWQVIQDAAHYSFNSSHALCVAVDGLYGMYLKANYPLEYFTVCLNEYKDKIDITSELSQELSYFNINMVAPKFRYSGSGYTLNKEKNSIYKGVTSIKDINEMCGDALWEIRNEPLNDFVDFMYYVKENKLPIKKNQIEALIKVDFFEEFGKQKKLLKFLNVFLNHYKAVTFNKETINSTDWFNIDFLGEHKETNKTYKEFDIKHVMKNYFQSIEDVDFTMEEKIANEIELAGTIINSVGDGTMYYVLSVNTKYTPLIKLFSLKTGKVFVAKVNKKQYANNKIKKGTIIYVGGFTYKPRWIKTDTGFEQHPTEKELHIVSYTSKVA